jgi:tetratricopeptide (TPR) repeat protein
LERARQLVEPLDDESTLAAIYSYLAGGWQHLGRFYESMEWARRTVALGERKNYELAQAYGYEFLAEDSMAIGNWNDTITFAARDRQIGEKLGALARIAWAEYCHSWALHGMGALAHSAEAAHTSLQLAERVGDRRLFCMVQCLLGIVQADLGQADEALTNAELAMAHSEELQHIVIQTLTRSGLGYVYLHRGEPSRALELLDRAFALIAPTENRWVRLTSGANRAEAYLGTGRLGEAAEIITENLALARDSRSRHWEGLALHVEGQILAAQNKSAEAERTFEQAVSILQELGSRLELGRALYHLANLQSERNDAGAAHSHWTRALALFDECGAQPDASRVREKLEKIAIR